MRRLSAIDRGGGNGFLLLGGCSAKNRLPGLTGQFQVVECETRKMADFQRRSPPAGSPNIVLILVDDVGFSATSTFGGAIQTPNFDRLAASGLRYNNFHVNSLCSPTRAALLSGRNNHQVGFGTVAESASGFAGYNSLWPKSAASVAEVLKDNGYSTAAFGKWHNTPIWQVSPVGPYDRWPTGLGFQHFYGFLAGYDNQYYPRLFRDTVPEEPPHTPQQGYSLTTDMTDEAIRWLHQLEAVAPLKPFFLYYAPGATHTPHQVPKAWIAKYKGKFDAGWDEMRRATFERQKKLGVIPANAELTPALPVCRPGSRFQQTRKNCWPIRPRYMQRSRSRPIMKLAGFSMRSSDSGKSGKHLGDRNFWR